MLEMFRCSAREVAEYPVAGVTGDDKRLESYFLRKSCGVDGEYICPGSGRGEANLGVVTRDCGFGDCLGVVGRLDMSSESPAARSNVAL